jgi:myo-inositol catabolism protein IolS
MQTRNLTKTIRASVIGFGGGSISGSSGGYGYGDISEGDAIATLEHAYRRGITLFDTAPIYGFGESERRIGKALAQHKSIRSNIVVVSKIGVTWDAARKVTTNNSPDTIHRMLEQSLKDLQTSYLDLCIIHWPDANTPIEATMETLLQYKKDGVIRAIGASNFGRELVERASLIAPIETLQSEFNALNNTNAEQLFPLCRSREIGFMTYGTFAKGILTGRVTPNRKYDASDFRGKVKFVESQAAALANEASRFGTIAKELNISPASLAIAYVLSFSEVSTALCGAKSIEQIDTLLNGSELILPTEVKHELDARVAKATPLYLDAYAAR